MCSLDPVRSSVGVVQVDEGVEVRQYEFGNLHAAHRRGSCEKCSEVNAQLSPPSQVCVPDPSITGSVFALLPVQQTKCVTLHTSYVRGDRDASELLGW